MPAKVAVIVLMRLRHRVRLFVQLKKLGSEELQLLGLLLVGIEHLIKVADLVFVLTKLLVGLSELLVLLVAPLLRLLKLLLHFVIVLLRNIELLVE